MVQCLLAMRKPRSLCKRLVATDVNPHWNSNRGISKRRIGPIFLNPNNDISNLRASSDSQATSKARMQKRAHPLTYSTSTEPKVGMGVDTDIISVPRRVIPYI